MDVTTIERDKPLVGGVVGFVLGMLRRGRVGMRGVRAEKQMKLLETLSLGPKLQLMLVACGERKYLVGTGADGVQTIVAVEEDGVRC